MIRNNMEDLQQSFTVKFEYKVYFTSGLFESSNELFCNYLKNTDSPGIPRKILFVLDQGVVDANINIIAQIKDYFAAHKTVQMIEELIIVPG